MKKVLRLTTAVIGLLFLQSCGTTQSYLDKTTLTQVIEQNEFTFMAQRANPLDTSANTIMNSIPGGFANRVMNLDYGYTIVFKKDEVSVNLPYFGRAYTAPIDPRKTGFDFDSKDFNIKKSQGKKGSTVLNISFNDQNTVRKMIMEVFQNGKAYVSVESNDKQPISYDGYIMKNEVKN